MKILVSLNSEEDRLLYGFYIARNGLFDAYWSNMVNAKYSFPFWTRCKLEILYKSINKSLDMHIIED